MFKKGRPLKGHINLICYKNAVQNRLVLKKFKYVYYVPTQKHSAFLHSRREVRNTNIENYKHKYPLYTQHLWKKIITINIL